jgi:RNA polymerase sigma factor (sigma-70 family)
MPRTGAEENLLQPTGPARRNGVTDVDLAWLLRILHNVNIDRFRAAKRMVPTVSELNGLDPAFTVHDTPESLVLAGFMEAEVFEALRGLPERLRTCLLADLQGLPQAEIAKDLGVPSGTVMSRLFRARQRLQRRLQPYVRNRRLIRKIRTEVGASPPTRTENREIAHVSRE